MAVYDTAHRLVRQIKNSDEYNDYQTAREKILGDEKSKEMLMDFQREQFKLQAKQFSGQEITEEDREKLNNLQKIIDLNTKVKKYLEAEYRIGIMLNDLQSIIFGELKIGFEDDDEEEKHPE